MPIYEYKCLSCDNEFEVLVGMGVKDSTRCPRCKSKNLRKLFSTFGFSSGERKVFTSSCSTCNAPSCEGCKGG
ncbi:MAG: zinc ribbon domain-containing protein [Actinomycetota bacterium]|nr:zinc ribbon domain-containing protein [Actinomycetota bacterium]MDI6822402.1 zinc ribbon domain-containing protein [Actinomycetota bacterium]